MATTSKKTKSAASTAKSRQKAADTRKQNQNAKNAKKQLGAVILFSVGLLFIFLTLIPGQNVWLWVHNFLFGLFGWGAYLIAPAMIYIAVMSALDKPVGSLYHKLWQTVLLVILICAVTQAFINPEMNWDSFGEGIYQLYEDGVQLKGGGVVSALVSVPLIKLLGVVPARITILIGIFVLLMIITGATLADLGRTAAKPVKKIEAAYVNKVENNNLKKKNQRQQIDIPIDEEPVMPEHPVQSPKGSQSGAQALLNAKDKLLTAAGSFQPPLTPAEPKYPELQPENEPLPVQKPKKALKDPAPEMEISPDGQIGPKLKWKEEKKNEEKEKDDKLEIDDLIHKAVDQKNQSAEKPASEIKEQAAAPKQPDGEPYQFPTLDLLKETSSASEGNVSEELKANAQRLVDTLQSFGVQTRIIDISRGPAVTRYELQPSVGVKISKITSLADDIALNLAASGVRIEAPIPNKPAVGIEVPNKTTSTVGIREIIDSREFVQAKSRLTVALGKDISGNVTVADIAKMPHVLIAGATGSGKSVCINSIIVSLLFKSSPEEVKFLMVDPKVVELGVYNGIPHLLVPVVTDPRKAAGALNWAVTEMLKRYKLFADNSVRDLSSYNELAKSKEDLQPLPQIVIIIDELADLMMAAPSEVEDAICRLAQMARAAGMHLVIATQRPSVDVITGIIKANIPSRIAFAVSSQVDSRTILDSGGAEKLLGRGDMLFYPVGAAKPVRVQGCFVSDREVENVVSYIKNEYNSSYDEQIIEEIDKQAVKEKSAKGEDSGESEGDPMLESAIEVVVEAGQASTSLLQRRLKLGYARAARIVDEMEEMGIVGPYEGSKPRQVLITRQQWMERKLNQEE